MKYNLERTFSQPKCFYFSANVINKNNIASINYNYGQ